VSVACPDPAEYSNICQWVVEIAAAILLTTNMSYAAEQSPCRCVFRARKVPARVLCSTNSARPIPNEGYAKFLHMLARST